MRVWRQLWIYDTSAWAIEIKNENREPVTTEDHKAAGLNALKDRVANVIARYLQFPTINTKGDDIFRRLMPMVEIPWEWFFSPVADVLRYLAIPASSAPTESLFSKVGQIL